MYSENGGPGYIMSVGLLKQLPLKSMQACFAMGENRAVSIAEIC